MTIPNSVTSIESGAFYGCSSLTSVTIPNSVTIINFHAFYGCSSLTSVTIPNSVTIIGFYAFNGCSSLVEFVVSADNRNYMSKNGLLLTKDGKKLVIGVNGAVAIPDGVTSIGSDAFSGYSSLTSVTIPNSVTSISSSAFNGCSSLVEFVVSADNRNYMSKNGLLLTKDGKKLVIGVNGAVAIPDGVTSIGGYAFSGYSSLTSVTIPNSVTSIGSDAFNGCSSLTSVTIPNNVTSIGSDAFYRCSSLTSVTIPNSVTSIGSLAFNGCSKLTTVYLGEFSPFTESDLRGYGVGASVKIVRLYHDKVQLWEGGPYWATTNIGAEKPEDYGYYFWWGDTVGYKRENGMWVASDGSSSNFSFNSGNTPTYNKSSSTLQSEGWITAEGVLAPEHDAAHKHWGGDWRMPTDQEIRDLNNNCDWTWTTQNGVNGYVVRGRGDYSANSIFLPCAGYGRGTSLGSAGSTGDYWSSVPYTGNNGAWGLGFDSSYHNTDDYYRYGGQSVRPLQGFTK